MDRYSTYLFFKPYGVLSQFTKEHKDHKTLADYLDVEADVYPIGRLDKDSEGLLLLSNDKNLVNNILHPSKDKFKTYIVQIEGIIDQEEISKLEKGIELRINKKSFISKPSIVRYLGEKDIYPARIPPVRFRANIPTSWVEIQISEGKKHQVRKMFAAVGFPVLRLIRTCIANYSLGDLKEGECKMIDNS